MCGCLVESCDRVLEKQHTMTSLMELNAGKLGTAVRAGGNESVTRTWAAREQTLYLGNRLRAQPSRTHILQSPWHSWTQHLGVHGYPQP